VVAVPRDDVVAAPAAELAALIVAVSDVAGPPSWPGRGLEGASVLASVGAVADREARPAAGVVAGAAAELAAGLLDGAEWPIREVLTGERLGAEVAGGVGDVDEP
jgi:hypothetical protein